MASLRAEPKKKLVMAIITFIVPALCKLNQTVPLRTLSLKQNKTKKQQKHLCDVTDDSPGLVPNFGGWDSEE